MGREARNEADVELLSGDSLEDRFAALDREEHIETLLKDLKAKQENRPDRRSFFRVLWGYSQPELFKLAEWLTLWG